MLPNEWFGKSVSGRKIPFGMAGSEGDLCWRNWGHDFGARNSLLSQNQGSVN